MDSPEFKRLRNHYRRKRLKEDEVIIEKMMMDLKDKHDQERKKKIEHLQQQLKKIKF